MSAFHFPADPFRDNRIRTAKTLLFIALCLPAAGMLLALFSGELVEPIEELTHATGEWALRLLLVTLAVTPLRTLTGWNRLIRFRRMLGLFSFAYMFAHFAIYLGLDRFFAWSEILVDLTERPYVMVGFVCLALCVPLAVTSTDSMMRRLGGRRWKRLHTLVYPASIAAVLHFLWLVKADITEPALHILVLAALLGWRLRHRGQGRQHSPFGGGRQSSSTAALGPGA
jgi:sulfoxide reductase heme-binding subunit YedZ